MKSLPIRRPFAAASVLALCLQTAALAAGFPERPLTVVVPFGQRSVAWFGLALDSLASHEHPLDREEVG